jgi:hypothetical protein
LCLDHVQLGSNPQPEAKLREKWGMVDVTRRGWVLKNSFYGILRTKIVRKLLSPRSPQALKFAEITDLVPFSTATITLRTPWRVKTASRVENRRSGFSLPVAVGVLSHGPPQSGWA